MTPSKDNDWPAWWEWELDLTAHVLKRMIDRGFNEIDLRSMMAAAVSFREDDEPDRWVVETWHESQLWEVIVEPDPTDQLLVVITAYPIELS